MKKISFIIHGKHRHSSAIISGIRQAFTAPDYEIILSFTERTLHAVELAKEAANSGSGYIVGVCGDGTFNEIVNGVMQSANKETIVGLLPHGTGNDFAKTVNVNHQTALLKQLIETASIRSIDLGLVHYKIADGKEAQRYFDNITDIGIGGFTALKMTGISKRWGAFLTFQYAIVSTFLSYKHQQVKIKADDFSYEGKILSCIMANGKYFGAGLGVAPGAKPDDGLFEIVLASEISLWDYVKNLGNIRKCIKVNHPHMNYFSAKEVTIETPERNLPIDMDGEFIGYSPMKATIVPLALKFLAPL
ncbi:MAG: YegS/Rv2252/BmrU family lipid kinase [Bacteroidota bacterium]